MSDIVKIIRGLHSIQHDILRVITVSKTVHELVPKYDPVIREKIRMLKTEISDKAILILIDYLERVLDNGTKSGFCDMANLIESMINVYLESDEPVKIEEEPHEQETKPDPPKENNGNNKVYRIMNKKHKIKRYKAGCIYDLILKYLVDNLPVDFLKSDVKEMLGEYYKKAGLRVPKDSSLNTYAGLYIRCGREVIPPVFKRTGEIGMGRGRGRAHGKYRKTGEKLKIENIEFYEVSSCKRWDGWEDKIIIDKHKKKSYHQIQQDHLPHRTVAAIEKHATSTLRLYATKIEDEPVKKEEEPDEKHFTTCVVDKFTQRKKEEPAPKIEKPEEKKNDSGVSFDIHIPINIKEKKPEEISKPIPTGDSSFSLKIKKKKDIVDFQSLPFPDQMYMYAEKSGWIGLKKDISFLVIKKHFPDKTMDDIKDAVQKLIIDNKVIQTGSGRINFKGDREVIK